MNVAPTTDGKRPSNLRLLVGYCLERDTLRRSVKTALVVGSILALINHGQQFLSGQFSASWLIPMLVTYFVPFSVATYGQVQAKRQRDLLHASSSRRQDAAFLQHAIEHECQAEPGAAQQVATQHIGGPVLTHVDSRGANGGHKQHGNGEEQL